MQYRVLRFLARLTAGLLAANLAYAQTMMLSLASDDFQVTTIFSDVDFFDIQIEIDAPLTAGVYVDPNIVSVDYQVTGTLVAGTPSGFPAFDLQRSMTGAEFYAQGSSLSFEIAQSAVLSDGVQVAELAGNAIVFTFNAREVDNGRFHPAILELDANGTGRIQNSDNIHTLNPRNEVTFGEEYITDLVYDPGNTTLIAAPQTPLPPTPAPPTISGGGGRTSLEFFAIILLSGLCRARPSIRTFSSLRMTCLPRIKKQ